MTLDAPAAKSATWHPNWCCALSNEKCVRVEASKKRLATSLRCGNCQSFCEAPKSCASMRMPMSSSFDRSRIRNRLFGFIAHPPVCFKKKGRFFCTKKDLGFIRRSVFAFITSLDYVKGPFFYRYFTTCPE